MNTISNRKAMFFIFLLGIVSLFADMTYEGARSITGQYLAILGATGTTVGIVAGLGELIGYGFRLVSGYISDKTGKYWFITFTGYIINLLAVPLLALADHWSLAAVLIVMERFGKAIRTPARDAMLSYATQQTGRGWGFGLHEAFDQIGAVLGPLIVSAFLYYQGSYQMSFAMLLIPAICALCVLVCARILYPHPRDLEIKNLIPKKDQLSKNYWLYIIAVSCVAAGYMDFPLIALHFEKMDMIPKAWIPIFFAIAMGADGISALIFGRIYDYKGISILIFVTLLSSFFVPFVFLNGFYLPLLGIILWGIGIGSQESIMRAVVADLVPIEKRGTAYGILNAWFGIFWFFGSALMGFLYDFSLTALLIFSFGIQLVAIPFLLLLKKNK
ncbi:multidrug resistance protein MdtH [Candidatus Rubidus massiliensis]|nr:multidrug resistance protein MdtH [Candidatus Rubidus massiliensis]